MNLTATVISIDADWYNEEADDLYWKSLEEIAERTDDPFRDSWYREIEPDEPGWSLVLVRTERGRRTLRGAMEAGYIKLERVQPEVLAASQKGLLNRRQNVFGRLLAMRIVRILVPHFEGFSLLSNWRELSRNARNAAEKLFAKDRFLSAYERLYEEVM